MIRFSIITSKGSKDLKDDLSRMAARMEMIVGREVLVGVPDDEKNQRRQGEMNNATLAFIHDNGSPLANIPARPFMEPGINSVRDRIIKALDQVARVAVQKGKNSDAVEAGLNKVGLIAQSGIRGYINRGVPPPLEEFTIYRRQHRKIAPRKGTKPLVDTGQLRNAINYVIRNTR